MVRVSETTSAGMSAVYTDGIPWPNSCYISRQNAPWVKFTSIKQKVREAKSFSLGLSRKSQLTLRKMCKNEPSGENGCRLLLLIVEFIELLAPSFTGAHIQCIMKFFFSILPADVKHLEAEWALAGVLKKKKKS